MGRLSSAYHDISDDGQADIDIAAGRVAIGANLMRGIDQFLRVVTIKARQGDGEIGGNAKATF